MKKKICLILLYLLASVSVAFAQHSTADSTGSSLLAIIGGSVLACIVGFFDYFMSLIIGFVQALRQL